MRRLHLITPLLLGFALATPVPAAHAQIAIGVSITIAPPILPIYVQAPLPAPGYIWTPGYWAWGPDGYYWVPGTWVLPPQAGLLWTPGYWGWNNGVYAWNAGYWGPTVGFYGGVNYGYGYNGNGYWGGRWDHGHFAYNGSVNNFGGVHVTNVYRQTVVINNNNRVAFNGGSGGLTARPTPQQEAFTHEQHVAPTALQTQHEHLAAGNPALRASVNHGAPAIAATSRPGEFTGRGVVPARPAATPATTGAPVHPGAAPLVHEPTTTTAHPGVVTPGTQVQHPVTPAVQPHPTTPAVEPHPTAPAVEHPTSPPPAPQPAPPPHPTTPEVVHPTTPAVVHPTAPAPAPHPAPAPESHPAAAAPHPAPAAHTEPQKDEHKQP